MMSDVVKFAVVLEQRLANADRQPHWKPGEAERYMAEVGTRRGQFEKLAVRLNDTVVQPRLETLAKYFNNSTLSDDEPTGRCACWFGYCERFPSSTRVGFAVEHDIKYEKASIGFEASMMPQFVVINDRDKLTFSLDQVDEVKVCAWVEERLLEFLDSYLQIDRGGDDFGEDVVTDPVCGMRISRSAVAADATHIGHPYYFLFERVSSYVF